MKTMQSISHRISDFVTGVNSGALAVLYHGGVRGGGGGGGQEPIMVLLLPPENSLFILCNVQVCTVQIQNTGAKA